MFMFFIILSFIGLLFTFVSLGAGVTDNDKSLIIAGIIGVIFTMFFITGAVNFFQKGKPTPKAVKKEVQKVIPRLIEMECFNKDKVEYKTRKLVLDPIDLKFMNNYKTCLIHKIEIKYEHVD